jgi:hypothetical protein
MLKKTPRKPWMERRDHIFFIYILYIIIYDCFPGGYYIAIGPLRESAWGGNSAKSAQSDPLTLEKPAFLRGKTIFSMVGAPWKKQPFTSKATGPLVRIASCFPEVVQSG